MFNGGAPSEAKTTLYFAWKYPLFIYTTCIIVLFVSYQAVYIAFVQRAFSTQISAVHKNKFCTDSGFTLPDDRYAYG